MSHCPKIYPTAIHEVSTERITDAPEIYHIVERSKGWRIEQRLLQVFLNCDLIRTVLERHILPSELNEVVRSMCEVSNEHTTNSYGSYESTNVGQVLEGSPIRNLVDLRQVG